MIHVLFKAELRRPIFAQMAVNVHFCVAVAEMRGCTWSGLHCTDTSVPWSGLHCTDNSVPWVL